MATGIIWVQRQFNNDIILVIVYHFTKLTQYHTVTSTITVPLLANLTAMKQDQGGTGFSNSIVTDSGTKFTSKFWTVVCYHLMIKCWLNTMNYPKSNRKIEWQNHVLEQYLRSYVHYHQDDWVY